MPAYVIFTRERTLEPQELQLYMDQVRATLDGHEFRLLAAYGPWEDLEGPPTEGTVIVEFPTMDAARAWYDSPAYREAREHRLFGAVYRALLVQGL
jgi:uncharacterized protein (DUF1330 family)